MNTFFLPYQIKWIQDESRIKIMEKSRQIGLSWATAYRTLRNAMRFPRTHYWICSRDTQQAQLFLDDCKAFANIFNKTLHHEMLPEKIQGRSILTLNNGSTLTILSSNMNAQAGKRGSRILDEFALHEDPEGLYNVAYPGITWGGQLEIISTHRGAHNFFNRLIEEVRTNKNEKKISLHRVTLTDALEQGFLKKLKAKLPPEDPRQSMDEGDYYNFIKNSCASEKSFLQEYMCQPCDDATNLLNYEALEGCFYTHQADWNHYSHGPMFMGIDLARTQDLSVFAVFEKLGDLYFLRELRCLKDARFDEQEAVFNHLFSTFQISHVCIDQTGIGRQFVERAQTRFGSHCIQGIQFSQKMKEDMAFHLKTHVDQHTLRIPRDEALIEDLLSLKLEENGKLSAQHSNNGHADRFWAIALALYADRKQNANAFSAEFFQPQKHYSLYEN